MAAQPKHRLFTTNEYEQMIQTGVLAEDERVELLEGEITVMNPIGSSHAACVKRLSHLFFGRLGGRAIVSVQDPIQVDAYSEPQPDLALLRPRADFYARAHPTAQDVLLVVEVAETSAQYDHSFKLPLYARAGVPEVWLVDLLEARIEVYRQPAAEGYREARLARRGERLGLEGMGVEFAVDEILG